MNLEPHIWGPHYWATLHFMASTYDKNPNSSIKATMKNFIQSLPVFLPCKECQDHAFDYIKKTSLDKVVENRMALFTFFFNFHNSVNLRLNKPLMKFEDALALYNFEGDSKVPKTHSFFDVNFKVGLSLTALLVFIVALFFFMRKKGGKLAPKAQSYLY
jgi:hypothetical protein